MRMGIVGSSGGSVFGEAFRILDSAHKGRYEFCVVTDRACGLETLCAANSVECQRIENRDNQQFSIQARQVFDGFGGVDVVLLFYSRLVTKELFRRYPTFNTHPSLLPAFKGFNAIKQALKGRARFLGSTLYLVDDSVDGGPIIAQVSMPILAAHSEAMLSKFSFIQKVYLMLLLVELIETESIRLKEDNSDYAIDENLPCSHRCNPSIRDPVLLNSILELQTREKVEVIA